MQPDHNGISKKNYELLCHSSEEPSSLTLLCTDHMSLPKAEQRYMHQGPGNLAEVHRIIPLLLQFQGTGFWLEPNHQLRTTVHPIQVLSFEQMSLNCTKITNLGDSSLSSKKGRVVTQNNRELQYL